MSVYFGVPFFICGHSVYCFSGFPYFCPAFFFVFIVYSAEIDEASLCYSWLGLSVYAIKPIEFSCPTRGGRGRPMLWYEKNVQIGSPSDRWTRWKSRICLWRLGDRKYHQRSDRVDGCFIVSEQTTLIAAFTHTTLCTARVFATATCPSVRLSQPVLCPAERKQDREMYTFW